MQRLTAEGANAAQIEYWNGPAGDSWAKSAKTQDIMIGDMGLAAMDACDLHPGHAVLDIGCGSGSTTLEIARRVGAGGRAVGIDISTPMLAVATERARDEGISNISFENRDVAEYEFEPAVFERVFSRFGVMFFADPVAAFANIKTAVKPGGRLAFVCWKTRTENEWMEIPFNAALRHVQAPPPPQPGEPGPTSFADPERVRRILSESGFERIGIELLELPISLGKDIASAVNRLVQLGPAGRLLRDASDETKAAVAAELTEVMAPFEADGAVRLGGRAWIVSAVVE